MKISELENLIIKNSSKYNLIKGKELLKNNSITKFNVHKIDTSYNIYGNFKSDNKTQNYSSHLKIDLKDERITLSKCSCHMFLESNSKNNIYLCEHLIATGLKFVEEIKIRLNSKNQNNRLRIDKKIIEDLCTINKFNINKSNENLTETLSIDVVLKESRDKNKDCFEVSFFIGNKAMYPILDVKDFIENICKSKEYYIGKGLVYNPQIHLFSNSDKDLIDYLNEYCIASNGKAFIKNIVVIQKEFLRRFLKIISDKKIKINYTYQNYIVDIQNSELPLTFTLKDSKDYYILTTKKIFPIPLNNKMDVFLYDRTIYLSSTKQIDSYKVIYGRLKEEGKILFNKDIKFEELSNLIRSLYEMSNNINIDKSIIEYLGNNIKIDFNFNKKEDKICCDVDLIFNEAKTNYNEIFKNKNYIFKDSSKIKSIESELNRHRFYYRDNTFIFYGTDDEYYDFLKDGMEELKILGEGIVMENQEKYFKLNSIGVLDLSLADYENGKFKLSFKIDGIERNQLTNIANEYKSNKTYIKLDDNTYVDLTSDQTKEVMELIETLNIDINNEKDEYTLELNKLFLLDNLSENINNNFRITISENLEKLTDLENNFIVPKNLNANLREYQIKGYKWIKALAYLGLGGILADEMGLGKTIQIISFLLSEENKRTLVIVPTSLLYNWKEEFDKFAPSLKIGIIYGGKDHRLKNLNEINKFDVIITTYGTLKNDFKNYEEILFDYIILDEGQNINNPKAQITKIVKSIQAKSRFILTGTPIENNLQELWSLFDFIMPGYLYSQEVYNIKFNCEDNGKLKNLKMLIKPYILRRLKSDVIKELPDKIENKYLVKMTNEQMKLYKEFIRNVNEKIRNSDNRNTITIFSYLTKLRQICLDPSIIIDSYNGGSGKIEIAKNIILENINEHKILLFSQFTSVLGKIRKELESEEIEYFYLDGSTSSKNRIKLVDEFNKNTNIRIFLISLKAGGTGLNLTSADTVIHFDPWWNPSVEDQATDRAHRIGQENNVKVIKLIAKDTIEEKILKIQEDKKSLISDVISGDLEYENLIKKLNHEEILKLFSES